MRNDGGRDGEKGILFILFEIVVQTLLRVVLFLFFWWNCVGRAFFGLGCLEVFGSQPESVTLPPN